MILMTIYKYDLINLQFSLSIFKYLIGSFEGLQRQQYLSIRDIQDYFSRDKKFFKLVPLLRPRQYILLCKVLVSGLTSIFVITEALSIFLSPIRKSLATWLFFNPGVSSLNTFGDKSSSGFSTVTRLIRGDCGLFGDFSLRNCLLAVCKDDRRRDTRTNSALGATGLKV